MSFNLTTAFDPGDLDPGHTYPKANIMFQSIRPEVGPNGEPVGVFVQYAFGSVVEGSFVKGVASPTRSAFITGTDYDTLVDEAALEAESYKIYSGGKRVLYEYLVDKGLLAGTVD